MNPLVAETAILILGLGNVGWLVLLGLGRLKTAGPARKGPAAPPRPVAKAGNGQQRRDASGRFASSKTTLHEAGTEAA